MATIPAALRPRLSRRAVATLLVAALGVPLVAGAGWIAFSDGAGLGAMEIEATGKVTILRGTERITVERQQGLEPLDVIETAKGATAHFKLEGSRSFDLAERSTARILSPSAVEPLAGDILAETSDPVKLIFGEMTATTSGATFRVDRTSSARTGVYSGTVHLTSPGQPDLDIQRLHELDVPLAAPDLSSAAPYRLDVKDVWDIKHLESVVALDKDLTQLAKGLSAQFAQARPPLSYYADVAGQPVGFMKPYMNNRPGDLIVGMTVADAAPGPLKTAVGNAFTLFKQGARWSVTAAIMKANIRDLREGLNVLIARSGLSGDGAGASLNSIGGPGSSNGTNGTQGGDGEGPGGSVPGTGPGGNETTPPPGSDPTNPPGTDPTNPPEEPEPEPTNPPEECTSDIECAVNDVEELDPPVENPLEQKVEESTGGVVNKKKPDTGLPGVP